jgi:hypothetical protein
MLSVETARGEVLSKVTANGALAPQSLLCAVLRMENANGKLAAELHQELSKNVLRVGVDRSIRWGGQMLMAAVLKRETLMTM